MNKIHSIATSLLLLGVSAASAQNLITNPGFESSGSGWTLWKDASASAAVAAVTYPTTGAHTGSRYAQVVVTTPSEQNWHIQFQPPSNWTASINASYEMKFWAKSAMSTSFHFSVQDGPANGFMYRSGFDFALTPEWTEYTFNYTSDVEGSGALRFFLYVGLNADTLGFDDFSLLETAAGINKGNASGSGQGLQVQHGAKNLTVSLAGVSENWTAGLYDLSGAVHSSASGRGEAALTLAHPGKSGTYVIRASSGNRTWVRKVSVQ